MKTYSGYTEKTPENLLLDAGAFFKNFNVEEDAFESAVKAGKLIGATKGGGEFSAVPAIRQVEVDGVKGRAKGLELLDSWDVYIKANVLEVTEETLKNALCSSAVDSNTSEKYTIIKGKNYIDLDDYIENVVWIGTLSGSEEPVIILVKNALNTEGLKVTVADKSEGVVPMTFYGHYSDNLDEPPFEIYYPKAEAVEEAVSEADEAEQV